MIQSRAKRFGAAVSIVFQIVFLLCGTSVAGANRYALFVIGRDGFSHPIHGYNEIVRKLRSGDIVEFSDGKSFQLDQDLQNGKGAMSRIFLVREPRETVLRLPQQSNSLQLDMINRSIDGYKALREAGVPVVSIQGSNRGEYLLVDQIKPGFVSADEFFRNSTRYDLKVRKQMIDRLIEFARKTAYFKQIGDFGLSQMVYVPSEDRWVLLDWTAGHKTMDLGSKSSNCFEYAFDDLLKALSGAEKDQVVLVQKKVSAAIQLERKHIRSNPAFLERLKMIGQEIVEVPTVANYSSFMDCFQSQMGHSREF